LAPDSIRNPFFPGIGTRRRGDVVVKAKPECCSEQNRNREKRLVDRGSVHDFALKKTIIEG
jgi:hypothetical protein